MIDFTDPTYGGAIRQIFNPAGDEHNLYHYRRVFNADNSRLLGIETPKGSNDYRVTLYDGDGRFLKKLFTQKEYDWTAAGTGMTRDSSTPARTGRCTATTWRRARRRRCRTFESRPSPGRAACRSTRRATACSFG